MAKTKPCPPSVQESILELLEYDRPKEEEDFLIYVSENGLENAWEHIFCHMARIMLWVVPDKKYPHPHGWRRWIRDLVEECLDQSSE